ncbi:MAG: CDP-alcohol phosphatidyltransferase family protein [Sphingobacteriaceae bacterium]|nr:CDP-alcohol phosphatidyltransferase family protein [Sphingobacteriaceae bacterium]
MKKHIPNAITCLNLLCGCLAIVKAMDGNIIMACYLVGLAALFDFFDGMAARILNVSSDIGKDLDSLADVVSFGVVPGIVMFRVLQFTNNHYIFSSMPHQGVPNSVHAFDHYLPYIAFLIPIFSALRLAKFNNDDRQVDAFIGLPTPANSIFFCSIAFLIKTTYYEFEHKSYSINDLLSYDLKYDLYMNKLGHPYFMAFVILIFCVLLVLEVELFSFKFKHFGWQGNQVRWLFILWSILIIVLIRFNGIPLIVLSYIGFSVLNNLKTKIKT